MNEFARPLPPVPGTVVSEEPFELDPDTRREVNAKIREIEECRAAAAVSAQFYVLHS